MCGSTLITRRRSRSGLLPKGEACWVDTEALLIEKLGVKPGARFGCEHASMRHTHPQKKSIDPEVVLALVRGLHFASGQDLSRLSCRAKRPAHCNAPNAWAEARLG